VKDNI